MKTLELIDFEKVNISLEGFNKSKVFVTAILAHSFDAFIAKPIDEQDFISTINTTLYGK